MTYAELTAAIKDYCQNTETNFVAAIPTFIKQAEHRIYRSVNLPSSRKNVAGTITDGNQYLEVPTDFLFPLSLAITSSSNQIFLLNKDANFIRSTYPNASTEGIPKYYGVFTSDTFIIGPTPNADFVTELHYYHMPASIVDAGSSWLGTNADTVLLYGCLVEAYTYMKGDADMMQLYQQRYQGALGLLQIEAEGRMTGDEYRDGTIRVSPQMTAAQ
tara:strand:+ start:1590 stop:2237 length:648 start_codon:yes stop_codon:yes gene_type:complete